MDDKNPIIKFFERFTSDESAIKRIPKYFFLIVVLLVIIAIELYQTNIKLDKIIDNDTEEKKQMVVEIFSEEEKTPADYMPILDTTTTEESTTETTTKNNSTVHTQSANNSDKNEYVINISSKKIHFPDCSSVARTKEENKKSVSLNSDELKQYLNDKYEFCKICGGN